MTCTPGKDTPDNLEKPARAEGEESAEFKDEKMEDYAEWARILGEKPENVRKRLKNNEHKAGKGELSERDLLANRSETLYRGSFVKRIYSANIKAARRETIRKAIDREHNRTPRGDTANIMRALSNLTPRGE